VRFAGGTGCVDNKDLGLVIDSDDRIYVANDITNKPTNAGSIDAEGFIIGDNDDCYLCAYSTDGDLIWERTWGEPIQFDDGGAVSLGSDGNIYAAGIFMKEIDLDPGPEEELHGGGRYESYFVSKFDPDGNYLAGRSWIKSNSGFGMIDSGMYEVATDPFGNVFVTGVCTPDTVLDWQPDFVWHGVEGDVQTSRTVVFKLRM
jgi:hypothetical protein